MASANRLRIEVYVLMLHERCDRVKQQALARMQGLV